MIDSSLAIQSGVTAAVTAGDIGKASPSCFLRNSQQAQRFEVGYKMIHLSHKQRIISSTLTARTKIFQYITLGDVHYVLHAMKPVKYRFAELNIQNT